MANSLVVFTPTGYTRLTLGATDYGGIVAWNGSEWAALPAPSFSTAATVAAFVSDDNSYQQVVLQNKSSGANAVTALVFANNLCDNANYYADFGMTSSGYTNVYDAFWELPNSVFFTANGSQNPADPVVNFNLGVARGLGSTNLFYNQGLNAYVFNTVGALSPRSDFTGGVLTTDFGEEGQVLTSAGPNAPPYWAAGGGGGGGSGTVTSVTFATGSTGLTISGLTSKTITTSGTFTLGGTLGVGYGGTGLSSVAAGKLLYASSANTLAAGTLSDLDWSLVNPSASVWIAAGQGSYLKLTGGENGAGVGGNAILRAGTGTSGSGQLLIGDANTSAITIGAAGITTTLNGTLALGTALSKSYGGTGLTSSGSSGNLLVSTGTTWASVALSGHATLDASGVLTLAAVGTAQTSLGSATKTVTATTDAYGRVTSLSEQAIAGLNTSVLTAGQLGPARGGTGLDASGITDGEMLIGQSTGSFAKHSLSGDATMDKDGAVTVTGLRGTNIAATAPVTGQVLQFDGTDYKPGVIPTGGSGGGGITYYFDYGTTTGISPTDGLPTTPVAPSLLGRSHVANATPLTSGDLTNGVMSLVCGFVTSATDPAVTNIPAGLWDFNIWASAPDSNAANQTAIQAKVYRYRSSDSSYTQIGISDAVYLYDLSTRAQYILSVVVQQTTILATDRIYIELWAQKTANPGQLRRVMFYFQADAPTHVHTTLPSVAGTGIVRVVDGVFQSPAAPISLNSDDTSGQLPVAKGGTGRSTLTDHALLIGQGASAVASLLGTATGQIVYWNGTDWTSTALNTLAVTSLTGTANQVIVSASVGGVTLSLPQSIGTSSTVTFAQVNTDTVNAPSGTFSITGGVGTTTVITPPAAASAIDLSLEGGAASTGNANGGNAYLIGGAKAGTGTNGAVFIGTSNTSAVTIGASGITTTVAGTLAAATAAVDTNTTQVATTAFVIGQGYLKSATAASTYQTIAGMSAYLTTSAAASTYAPLASPALTGTPTAPTAAADTNTTQIATTAFVIGQASSTTPVMNGTAAVGTSVKYARADHVHPTDTSRAPLASPTFTGTPAAPTASAGTNTTQVATTAFVTTAVANASGTPYDLPCEIPGTPDASKRVVNFKGVRAFILAATGHQGGCAVADPTGTDVPFTVKKVASGVTTTLGTITFKTDGTFTMDFSSSTVANRTFAVGDLLTVTTPSALNSMDTPFFTLSMTLA